MSRAPRKPTELYARLYCNILRNAKAVERSDLAWRVYVSSFAWCRDEGNDGHVPPGALLVLAPGRTKAKLHAAAGELVDAGLWEVNGNGWIIHDYLERQDGSEAIAANRDRARAAAAERWAGES